MSNQIYELGWIIGSEEFEFLKTEWALFESYKAAEEYGLREQDELNGGLPPDERAFDGYYYKYWYARPINRIGDCRIVLEPLGC